MIVQPADMPQRQEFNQQLIDFIAQSPTPFHAVEEMQTQLLDAGFEALEENFSWELEPGQGYFLNRNGSSLIAFIYGEDDITETGIRLMGAHTDSPCLKLKPNPVLNQSGYFQLGVEVYGGVLLNPWFDRDLSLAGRISYKTQSDELKSALINFSRPIAIIPSLAIHLDREANSKRSINAQQDISPILSLASDTIDFEQLLREQLELQHGELGIETILDYELSFYDVQPGDQIGLQQELITSARLDNLLSCFVGLQSLIQTYQQGSPYTSLLICSDHEEVGSASAAGAQGPMLKSVLQRLLPDVEERSQCFYHSLLISIDNAHGIHPNFANKHDANHGPLLNAGPVIKINANQRYASNSETQARFRYLAELVDEPVQAFVVRSDMACGSTIGPITATETGINTIDVGVPSFAMHSIRETAGSADAYALYKILQAFCQQRELGCR